VSYVLLELVKCALVYLSLPPQLLSHHLYFLHQHCFIILFWHFNPRACVFLRTIFASHYPVLLVLRDLVMSENRLSGKHRVTALFIK
jgi:hypothetical protein